MNKEIKTGGAAFPSGETYYDGAGNLRGKNSLHEGMTLRDYFASKTLQGLLANPETNRSWDVYDNAKYAYQQADAMIEARGNK